MERVQSEFMAAVQGAGAEVGVLTTPVDRNGRAPLLPPDYRVWTVAARPGKYSVRWWYSTYLRGPWSDWRPDVVIGIGDAGGAVIMRNREAVRAIQVHGTIATEFESSWRSPSVREYAKLGLHVLRYPSRLMFLRSADAVWPVSLALGASLSKGPFWVDSSRISPLYNGVEVKPRSDDEDARRDFRRRLSVAEEASVGIFAGRLHVQKGTLLAIRAMAELSDEFVLLVAGTGPHEATCRAEVARLQLGSRVKFLGHLSRDDLNAALQGCDVALIPSLRSEGAPMVALEAAAAGLPIIATAHARLEPPLSESAVVAGATPSAFADAWRTLRPGGGTNTPYLPEHLKLEATRRAYVSAVGRLYQRHQ